MPPALRVAARAVGVLVNVTGADSVVDQDVLGAGRGCCSGVKVTEMRPRSALSWSWACSASGVPSSKKVNLPSS